jgi:hypothetical protein
MGLEEGNEIQTKGIDNIFNRIITENFPNFEIESHTGIASLQNTKPSGPKEECSRYIIIKTISTQNKERILKAAKEKRQIKYKGKPIRVRADFSIQTKCKKLMGRHNPGSERKQLSTQTSLPSKTILPN